MYPMIGSQETTRSPSRTSLSRSTPWVDGCWGPMLSTMSAVSRPVPVPTVSSRVTASIVSEILQDPQGPGDLAHGFGVGHRHALDEPAFERGGEPVWHDDVV